MLMFLQITQVSCENANSNPGSTQQGPRWYTSNIPRHGCCRWPRNQTLRSKDRLASHSPAMNMPLAWRPLLGVSNGPESTVGAKNSTSGKKARVFYYQPWREPPYLWGTDHGPHIRTSASGGFQVLGPTQNWVEVGGRLHQPLTRPAYPSFPWSQVA